MRIPYLANLAEDVEGLTGTEGDNGALDVLALAGTELGPADLALAVDGVNSETLTPKICSTAILISVLFDRGSTSKVYLPWSISE